MKSSKTKTSARKASKRSKKREAKEEVPKAPYSEEELAQLPQQEPGSMYYIR